MEYQHLHKWYDKMFHSCIDASLGHFCAMLKYWFSKHEKSHCIWFCSITWANHVLMNIRIAFVNVLKIAVATLHSIGHINIVIFISCSERHLKSNWFGARDKWWSPWILHKIEIITEKLKMINFARDANKTCSGSF